MQHCRQMVGKAAAVNSLANNSGPRQHRSVPRRTDSPQAHDWAPPLSRGWALWRARLHAVAEQGLQARRRHWGAVLAAAAAGLAVHCGRQRWPALRRPAQWRAARGLVAPSRPKRVKAAGPRAGWRAAQAGGTRDGRGPCRASSGGRGCPHVKWRRLAGRLPRLLLLVRVCGGSVQGRGRAGQHLGTGSGVGQARAAAAAAAVGCCCGWTAAAQGTSGQPQERDRAAVRPAGARSWEQAATAPAAQAHPPPAATRSPSGRLKQPRPSWPATAGPSVSQELVGLGWAAGFLSTASAEARGRGAVERSGAI